MSSTLEVRPLTPEDWPVVRAIYEDGIATGDATFDAMAPSWEAWDDDHFDSPRLVAHLGPAGGDEVIAWTALTPVSRRPVYRGVADVSIYVAAGYRGRGVGRVLLRAMIARSEAEGLWTLQAGVFPENAPSLALHRACGFRVVGTRERMGFMDGRWRDVVLLERRSGLVE
jgi:L-amino acid N-acyltransferase YncA